MIDAATGVAGKITPGSRVNIYATFKAENDKAADQSKVIVAERRGHRRRQAHRPRRTGQSSSDRRTSAGQAVPITFALGTADAQRVAYAESFAEHVRLALVAAGCDAAVAPGDRTYTLDEDK